MANVLIEKFFLTVLRPNILNTLKTSVWERAFVQLNVPQAAATRVRVMTLA